MALKRLSRKRKLSEVLFGDDMDRDYREQPELDILSAFDLVFDEGQLFYESDDEEEDNYILENFGDRTIKDHVNDEAVGKEIERRFKRFLRTFKDEHNQAKYINAIKEMAAHNRESIEVDFCHLASNNGEPNICYFLLEAPVQVFKRLDNATTSLVVDMFPGYLKVSPIISVRICNLPDDEGFKSLTLAEIRFVVERFVFANDSEVLTADLEEVELDDQIKMLNAAPCKKLKQNKNKEAFTNPLNLPSAIETLMIGNYEVEYVRHFKEGVCGNRVYRYVHICPFSKINACAFWVESPAAFVKHLKAHFDIRVSCFFCSSLIPESEPVTRAHLEKCMPVFSSTQRSVIAKICYNEEISFTDVQKFAKQLWVDPDSVLDINDFDLIGKRMNYKKFLPIFFKTNLFEPLTFNAEFTKFLKKAQKGSNRGLVYGHIEITYGYPDFANFPEFIRRVGSTVADRNRKSKQKKGQLSKDETKEFGPKLQAAITDGHSFARILLIGNIKDDYLLAIEDCLKRVAESASFEIWNVYTVSRIKESCPTREWPYEKVLLLGYHIIRKEFSSIATQVKQKKNFIGAGEE
ncbi:DNA replication licensing factor MCM2 [Aphelenchoides bicaudatus]|nr:DNA replication licensing factor MCM2 [Aphelenchoides bicaudatus]